MQDLLINIQSVIAEAPAPLAALLTALAGAIPFVEGEGAAAVAVLGGVNPVVAGVFGALGNLICVAAVVLISARARRAVVAGIDRKKARVSSQNKVAELVGPNGASQKVTAAIIPVESESPRAAARRVKFAAALEKYGVPGVSLLGPLLLPTAFTASMLTAAGVRTRWVMLWQTIAIIGWTAVITVMITMVVNSM